MKINELLNKRPTLSFEIFPPKNNENDITSIYATIDELAKLNPLYVKDAMEQYGYTAQQLGTLNIPNFIFNNLIPVTIGNIVGGMAFFGIPLMYINGVGGKKA